MLNLNDFKYLIPAKLERVKGHRSVWKTNCPNCQKENMIYTKHFYEYAYCEECDKMFYTEKINVKELVEYVKYGNEVYQIYFDGSKLKKVLCAYIELSNNGKDKIYTRLINKGMGNDYCLQLNDTFVQTISTTNKYCFINRITDYKVDPEYYSFKNNMYIIGEIKKRENKQYHKFMKTVKGYNYKAFEQYTKLNKRAKELIVHADDIQIYNDYIKFCDKLRIRKNENVLYDERYRRLHDVYSWLVTKRDKRDKHLNYNNACRMYPNYIGKLKVIKDYKELLQHKKRVNNCILTRYDEVINSGHIICEYKNKNKLFTIELDSELNVVESKYYSLKNKRPNCSLSHKEEKFIRGEIRKDGKDNTRKVGRTENRTFYGSHCLPAR